VSTPKATATTLYLWLDGCDPAYLTVQKLEALLQQAVLAGGFELLYANCSDNAGRIVALGVVGDSHLVLHADTESFTLCAEVLSCTTVNAAIAAVNCVRAAIPHGQATEQRIDYDIRHDSAPQDPPNPAEGPDWTAKGLGDDAFSDPVFADHDLAHDNKNSHTKR
jgi:S-adenosylmethionine/arginine decarboxylase-like enzyme